MTAQAPTLQKISIAGSAGPIEAIIERPPGAITGIVAVCCHPHPLYGGTMQNKVVHTLARAAQDRGVTSLRFNFRGVGGSGGMHDKGVGESDDAAAVADWCRHELGAGGLWALGFSFGSYVALRLAAVREAHLLVTVAPPVQRFDFVRLEVPRCPWLVVQGDADTLVNHEAVLGWARDLNPAPQVEILPGAEHFFHGRLTVLRALVGEWLGRQLKTAG
ncbi:MAG: alpha/beta fold hydrolase [Gammaproteobacteria bacterium]|nr:alpha/beta fold hydrolase [Gammaproteobacteria bacterium]